MALKDDLLKLVSRYTGGRVGYDGGGTVSTADILDGMSASDITRDIRPGPDVRGRLQDQAMRGVELSPLQREELRMYLERGLPERREIKSREMDGALPAIARTLAPPIPGYNFPTYEESTREFEAKRAANMERRGGMTEGERMLDLAKEYGTEAGPYAAGPMVAKAAPYVAAAAKAIPKSVYASVPLAGMFAPSEAQSPGQGDPRVGEIAKLEKQIEAEKKALKDQGTQFFQSNLARENAAKPHLGSIDSAQRRISDLQREMREDAQKAKTGEQAEMMRIRGEAADKRDAVLRDAPKPFSREWQETSKWMPWMPLIAGGITGALFGGARTVSNRGALNEWDRALDRATNTRLSPATREMESAVARGIADKLPVKTGMDYFKSKAGEYSGPALAGAAEGIVSTNVPNLYNTLALKDENAERKALQTYYRNLAENDPERSRTKALLDDESVLPKGNLDYQAAMNFYSDWQKNALPKIIAGAAEGAGATLPGSSAGTAFSPWNRTLSVRHAKTDALPKSYGSGSSPPTPPTPLNPPTGGGGALPPPLPPQRALPPPLPPVAPPAPKATPDPATSVSATTTSKAPAALPDGHSWIESGRGSKVKGPDGRWTEMGVVDQNASASKLPKGKQPKPKTDPDEDVAGFVAGKPVPKKPDPELNEEMFKGRRDGGRLLDMARRYADGGSVLPPGLVAGPTPGRADALDVEVPNGAFIVPADCVSGIKGADNNTEAGAEIWQQILPKPSRNFASGGTIPIRISHGEIVISPDQVAAIGGGDIQQGHRILDQMILKIREENINHLASLPPPAQS